MPEHALRRATQGVIFDTNVMLAYLVGLWKPEEIPRFKRTAAYSKADFHLLCSVALRATCLVTTPHILTEVCNLADTLNKQHGGSLYQRLAGLLSNARERRQEAVHLMDHPLFCRFGIADISLIEASRKQHLVITDDAALYAAIAHASGLAFNLNHLRGQVWFGQ
jgi:hypothetical protein